jgi:hypothetical protein
MAATKSKTTAASEPEPVEPTPEPKPKTVRDSEIAWGPDEASEGSVSAIVRGFELSVSPVDDKPGRWLWSVRATSEVSETPELIAADECASEKGGRRWARQTLNRTLKTWQGKGVSA